ncbi:MAG: hypothetical protein SFU25_04255 [Candidatus Caenarcaniphilales bacterium]|nr:hypothetical protein [Candidatus Caenarcaniphilales bacterium]
MKLFKPYSSTQSPDGREKKVFQWFIVNRKQPLIDYRQAIWDYEILDGRQKLYAECSLDELFSEYELLTFKDFLLKNSKTEVKFNEQNLPLFFTGEKPYGSLISSYNQTRESGFYPVCQQASYNLPFQVWGFYSTESVNPSERFIYEFNNHDLEAFEAERKKQSVNYSVEFVSKALNLLGFYDLPSVHEIQTVCSYLNDEGYQIEKGLSRSTLEAIKSMYEGSIR